ncbi:MAG: peptidylprolyl isomerase [Planctomycetes bacterium]|nr:peptidylprolyl isomerase [Planctomycetota bacterium]
MAAERTSGIDFTGLEETFEWFKAKKNLFVGVALILALVWAASTFVENQQAETERAPWQVVFGGATDPWRATPDELAQMLADPKVKGTPAEPYLHYWQALRKQESGDAAGALELLAAFKRNYAGHLLATAKLPGSDFELRTAVERMEAQILQLEQWKAAHPLPTANPAPTGTTVTLVTDRGNVVIGLYPDVAPQSCAAFLKVAASLKEQFIAKLAPDKWIEVGATEAGTPVETKEFTENFPPFESNALTHFAGAVSFRQPPFGKGPFNPDVRIMLGTDLNEDGRSTVFGQVTAGLEILAAIAKEARKADNPQLLEKPVKITDVQIAGAAPAGG